jgi:murein DD-endopeptidase MepM/ murein hydrolase activator NlpD
LGRVHWCSALLILALSGCLPLPQAVTSTPTTASTPLALPSRLPTPLPSHPAVVLASPTLSLTPTPVIIPASTTELSPSLTSLCSPLEGVQISDLNSPDLLKNPYAAARPGYDDGHPGIDLAFWTRPDGKAMLGLPVHSVLDGTVSAVLPNRQPFGNALIIETTLDHLPPAWLALLSLPAPRHDLQPSFSLSCPDTTDFKFVDHMSSIYLLYAHLNQPSNLQPGDAVTCGQPVGEVGTTGKSINPHLHLEARHGPSGVIFASMGHYDTAATQEEMRSYCLWRISGAFQPFDPLKLFQLPPPS